MSTNKNNLTPKKKPVEDVFKSLKYVDAMMNESAKTSASKEVKESFEAQLKAKLLEGEHKENSEETVEENRFTQGQNYNYPTYNYEDKEEGQEGVMKVEDALPSEEPEGGVPSASGTEGLPTEEPTDKTPKGGSEGGLEGLPTEEPGAEGGAGGQEGPEGLGGSAELPGGSAGEGPEGGTAPGAEGGLGDTGIEGTEDIEALVDELIAQDNNGAESTTDETTSLGATEETKEESVKQENTMKEAASKTTQTLDEVLAEMQVKETSGKIANLEEPLKSAGAETITSKNSDAAKKVDQTKAQGDANKGNIGDKLGDKDLESTVKDKKKAEENKNFEVSGAKKIDQTKAQGDPDKAGLGGDYKDLGAKELASKVKKESVIKSKALYALADKYLTLEDQNRALKFQNFKTIKANGILAVSPDLSESTKISLVKKFDECKTYKEATDLYESILGLVKKEQKPSLEETTGRDKSIKVLKEEKTAETKEVLTEKDKRIRFLSGEKGYDDQYFSC